MNNASHKKHSFLIYTILSLALLFASCSKEQTPIFTIDSGGAGGSYLAVGRAISRVVNENQSTNGFQLQNNVSSGSVSNIDAITAGEAQFGVAQADHLYQAVKGTGEWKEKGPQGNLRAVFSMYTESVTLVAGGDSDIRSVHDLKGKNIDIGSSGSGTHRNAIDALRAAGIDWRTDIQAYEKSLDDRLAMFMRGELDAFFFTVGHPNREIKFATLSVRGARLIPIANIDSLIAEKPYLFRTSIPSTLYPMARSEGDVETIGINATLLASADVSEDVVYAVTKTIFENLESLAEFNTEFDALSDDLFLEGLTAPIHPGALKYYKEIGLQVPSP